MPEADKLVVSNFEKLDDVVTDVQADGDHVLIHRRKNRSVRFGVVRRMEVHAADIEHLFDGDLDFIVNVPTGGLFREDAIEMCKEAGVGWGRLADGMRAVYFDDPGEYLAPELRFVLAGLHRHSHVESVSFLDSHRVVVTRVDGLDPLTLYIEPAYQASIETVHFALDRCSPFDIFVATNPNRGPTIQAEKAAAEGEVEILRWRPLLSRLRR